MDRLGIVSENYETSTWAHTTTRSGDVASVEYRTVTSPGSYSSSQANMNPMNMSFLHPMQAAPLEVESMKNFLASGLFLEPFRNVSPEMQVGAKAMINPLGGDLAQVLHSYYNRDRERFDGFEEIMRAVLPEIDMIETPLTSGPSATIQIRFKDDAQRYDLWQLSSGVKETMLIVAAVHFSPAGQLIVLEEPENHLHPASQKAIAAVLKRAAETEDKQLIVTTHSETILGQFAPDDVLYIDKYAGRSRAERLSEADVYQVWERLGIDRGVLLQILGRARQTIVIVEGRSDYKVLESLWDAFGLTDKVLPANARGGGWREIVDQAAALRDAMERFNLPSTVFVLLDNAGNRDEKGQYLTDRDFDDDHCHVWQQKEIESYLLLPDALSRISGRSRDEVEAVIAGTKHAGKEKLDGVLQRLGIADTPVHTIVRNLMNVDAAELPTELREVMEKVRRTVGLP